LLKASIPLLKCRSKQQCAAYKNDFKVIDKKSKMGQNVFVPHYLNIIGS